MLDGRRDGRIGARSDTKGAQSGECALPHRLPVAVYLGADHVLVYVNEVWRALFVGEPPLEVPAREAFIGEGWNRFIRAMDLAYATGEKVYTECEDHDSTVVILPLKEGSQTVGLATACRLERIAPMPGSRPRERSSRLASPATAHPARLPLPQ